MAEFDVTTGIDTWVRASFPTANNSTGRYPKVQSGEYRTLLFMALGASRIGGKTILSATLSVPVQANWVTQTVTVQALATNKSFDRVNWDNQPGVVGATASSGATGALASGDRFDIDITALVQAIADGQPNYGWRISTSQSTDASAIRGFDSGLASWTLNVEVSDLPPTPSNLSPAGVIGIDKPVLMVDDTDDMAQMQVQIDATPSGTNADYDTGWVATTQPQIDMSDTFPSGTAGGVADTTYNGLADGATTNWRARVKLTDGSTSPWSDWAEITRDAKPSMVMDNPSGTDIWDPTPTITAHLSPAGDADTRWQVIVTSVADPTDVRYNSGDALEGATLAHTIPLRWNGRRVMHDDGDYRLVVKAWDRSDRVPSPGDTPFVRTITTVTLDVDGTQTAPDSLAATQAASGYPEVSLHWERASDPDWFAVRRDGEFLATVDVDEFRTAPGEWDWVDETAEPNVTHTYYVRAVTDVAGVKKQSGNSNAATIFATVKGVWLRSDFGDIELFGSSIDARQVDKRQTFDLAYRSENVDIVTAVGGFEGTFDGVIDNRPGATSVDTVRTLLEQLRQAPATAVRMVWGTQNRWVRLRGLSVGPSQDIIPARNRKHDVKFGFYEIDEPD